MNTGDTLKIHTTCLLNVYEKGKADNETKYLGQQLHFTNMGRNLKLSYQTYVLLFCTYDAAFYFVCILRSKMELY